MLNDSDAPEKSSLATSAPPPNKLYITTSLKPVTTIFGPKVVAELESEYDVSMAKRVSEALLQDEKFLTNLQDAANKCELFMIYNGGSSVEFSDK